MPARKVVTNRQLELLVEFMETHRGFAVGRLSNNGPLEKQQVSRRWEYWNEKKYGVRRKASEVRQHACGTGGGPAKKGALTPLEERILAILGKTAVLGCGDSVRIPFNDITPLLAHGSQNTFPLRELGDSERSPPASHSSTSRQLLPAFAPEPVACDHPSPALPHAALCPPAYAPPELTEPGPAEATPARRTYMRSQVAPPQWALDLEERRVAAEERQAQSLEALLSLMTATQRFITHIEQMLEAALGGGVQVITYNEEQ